MIQIFIRHMHILSPLALQWQFANSSCPLSTFLSTVNPGQERGLARGMARCASRTASSIFLSAKCALKCGEPLLRAQFCRSLSGGPRTSTGSKGPGADDDVVKQAFATQQKRFRMYIEEMAKQKLDLDTSEASMKNYFQLREKIREKLGVDSYTCKIAGLLEEASDESPDVRSFLEQYRSFRIETGIEDDLGADALMFAALDKVEKNIKKRLTRDNADGISQLKREFDQINSQLKLNDSELEQLEDEAEMAVVKAELMELASTATEKMATFVRRDDLKVDVNLKDLDPRSCL